MWVTLTTIHIECEKKVAKTTTLGVKICYQSCGVCICAMRTEWELCSLMNVERWQLHLCSMCVLTKWKWKLQGNTCLFVLSESFKIWRSYIIASTGYDVLSFLWIPALPGKLGALSPIFTLGLWFCNTRIQRLLDKIMPEILFMLLSFMNSH